MIYGYEYRYRYFTHCIRFKIPQDTTEIVIRLEGFAFMWVSDLKLTGQTGTMFININVQHSFIHPCKPSGQGHGGLNEGPGLGTITYNA